MASSLFVLLLLIACLSSSSSLRVSATYQHGESERTERTVGRRILLGFIETPRGSNRTFECSPSGPCVPCLYSEKNDEKYRCSETGYRIPLTCVEIDDSSKDEHEQKAQGRSTAEISVNGVKPHVLLHDVEDLITSIKHRSLLDASSTSEDKSQGYTTYRSCILSVNEEKLSVLGFESIVLCLLLISSSVVYFRRRRTVAMPGVGAGRIQGNSRF